MDELIPCPQRGAAQITERFWFHSSARRAGHLMLWLVLIGLAAAVVYVLLDPVLASAGGLGPHTPGPLPHPVPVPNPAPSPPGS
jgi:hypothetical protein